MDDSDHAPDGDAGGVRAWIASIPLVPLPFLGFGLYRGWLTVLFDDGLTTPAGFELSQSGFDVVVMATLLSCALIARRVPTSCLQRWQWPLCAMSSMGASLLGYAFLAGVLPADLGEVVYTLLAGFGAGLATALWVSLFGKLAPVRTCLYYAASLVLGGLVGWFYQGFLPAWLPLATALLPLAWLRSLRNCQSDPGLSPTRPEQWVPFSFPWKPVLVIAVYAFAYGLLQPVITVVSPRSSAPGTMFCALVVALIIMLGNHRVEFGPVYGLVMPLLSALGLSCAVIPGLELPAINFLANWGYTSAVIYVTTMLCSICYHWGVNAVWLFGIESIARLSFMMAGRLAQGAFASAGIPVAPLLVVVVAAATAAALRERRLSSSWGMRLSSEQVDPEATRAARERAALTQACAKLAHEHHLSQREEEVLRLLAQHKTARDIEHELGVANGTAKAHVRHVYQKLDIHTREELFGLVERARK